ARRVTGVTTLERLRVFTRVQLDRVDAHVGGHADVVELGIDEERDPDAGVVQLLDSALHATSGVDIAQRESALRRDLLAPLRHERGGHGPELGRDRHDVRGSGELQVNTGAHRLHEEAHVTVLYVAPVLAQVHGDPVRPAELGEHCRTHGVGLVRATSLPHRSVVIDVDMESHQPPESRASISAARCGSSPAARESRRSSIPSAQYSARSCPDNRARCRRTVSTSPRPTGPVSAPRTPRFSRLSSVPRTSGSSACTASPSGMPTSSNTRTAAESTATSPFEASTAAAWYSGRIAGGTSTVYPPSASAMRRPAAIAAGSPASAKVTPAIRSAASHGSATACNGWIEPTAYPASCSGVSTSAVSAPARCSAAHPPGPGPMRARSYATSGSA